MMEVGVCVLGFNALGRSGLEILTMSERTNVPTTRGILTTSVILGVVLLVSLATIGTLMGWGTVETIIVAAVTACVGSLVNAAAGFRQLRKLSVTRS